MALTDVAVRKAEVREKAYKLADGGGMYLEVMPNGSKYWRLKYRVAGKEKRLALGVYPAVSLAEARRKRDEARQKVAAGVDPSAVRKAEKRTARLNAANSFEAIAREWHERITPSLSTSHSIRNLRRLELYAFPRFGGRPIADLVPADVLEALRRVEGKGTVETAHRLKSIIGQVMRYAVSTGRATRDITADLRDALAPVQVKHYAAVLEPAALGALLRAMDGYAGTRVVAAALRLAPLVALRPGEVRQAEWSELDLDGGMWTVPCARMKRRKAEKENGQSHLVPLSSQAVSILRDLHGLTGNGRYVFPSARGASRPMSDMALSAAFKRMGIDADTALPHGWRATLRTLAVEQLGFPAEAVELQLAHGVRDALGRAYNRVQWLDIRRDLMQRWADYLDQLKQDTKARPLSEQPA